GRLPDARPRMGQPVDAPAATGACRGQEGFGARAQGEPRRRTSPRGPAVPGVPDVGRSRAPRRGRSRALRDSTAGRTRRAVTDPTMLRDVLTIVVGVATG